MNNFYEHNFVLESGTLEVGDLQSVRLEIVKLTIASFLSFKRQEAPKRVFFGLFDQKMKSNISSTPPRVTPKFDGGSFELIKKIPKIFTGSLTGIEAETHRFDQATEVI